MNFWNFGASVWPTRALDTPDNKSRKFAVKRPTKYRYKCPWQVRQKIESIRRKTLDKISRKVSVTGQTKYPDNCPWDARQTIDKIQCETSHKISGWFTVWRPTIHRDNYPWGVRKMWREFIVIRPTEYRDNWTWQARQNIQIIHRDVVTCNLICLTKGRTDNSRV